MIWCGVEGREEAGGGKVREVVVVFPPPRCARPTPAARFFFPWGGLGASISTRPHPQPYHCTAPQPLSGGMLGNGDAGRRGRGADHPPTPPSLDGPNAMAGASPRPHARALLALPSAPPLPMSYRRQVGRVRVPVGHDVARRLGDDGRGGGRGSGQGGGGGGCRRERKQRRTHAGGGAHTKKNGAWRDAEGGKTPARGLGWRQGVGAWVGVCDSVSRRVASARGRRRLFQRKASPEKKSGG